MRYFYMSLASSTEVFPIYAAFPKPKIKLIMNGKKNSKTPHVVDFPKDFAMRRSSLITITITAIAIAAQTSVTTAL